MKQYVIFREEFQRNSWSIVGSVVAEDPHHAVKVALNNQSAIFGTYAAIAADDFNAFVEGRTLVRVVARLEDVEPHVAEPAREGA